MTDRNISRHRFPATTIRIDPKLKAAAAEKAAAENKTVTDVIRESLEQYVSRTTDTASD